MKIDRLILERIINNNVEHIQYEGDSVNKSGMVDDLISYFKELMASSTVWVITREINQYDQDGRYLMYTFTTKPSIEKLNSLGFNGEHLFNGGGRIDEEYEWYYLEEVESGQLYTLIQ